MPFLVSALAKLLTEQALGKIAIAALHEVAKRTGNETLHEAIHIVGDAVGVALPTDLPPRAAD